MSDLDDFFAKKLEEEASFPNRNKNWKQMSQRLDAFDSGAVQGGPPRLRIWQAVTLLSLVTTGLLLWRSQATQLENKALQETVLNLETERSALKQQLSQRPIEDTRDVSSTPLAAQTMVNERPVKKNQNSDNSNQIVQKARPIRVLPAEVNSTSTNLTTLEKDINLPTPGPVSAKADVPVSVSLNELSQLIAGSAQALDSVATQPASANAVANAKDSIQTIATPKDSVLKTLEKAKDSVAISAPIAQEIKPTPARNQRFKIGTQATLGFVQPKQKGISAIRGQGITLEAKVLPSVWVTGSVDWLHHEVCTEGFVAKFHPKHDSFPNPPDNGGGGSGGGQHKPKLVLVESTSRQQNIGLGIRYMLPVEFWVRPSLALSHHWVHTSPTLVTYKFEEEDPGGPGPNPHNHETRYTAESFESHWISNQWRLGVGIEKELANWTFGLSADYSKDFSASIPGFDALYLRAGAQYRF